MEPLIELTYRSGAALITLNRPRVHHAIDDRMMARFEEILDECESNDEVKCLVLTASGSRTFCAGGDLRYFATLDSAAACREMSLRMQGILRRLRNGVCPVIAAVNGQALGGGCEILTACHIRIAADHAQFSFRQAPNGIITGWGGGGRLFRQVSRGYALKLLLSGRRIDAVEAQRIGLVEMVVTGEQLLDECLTLAAEIAANPPDAVRSFLALADESITADAARIQAWETERFADLWMGKDFREFIQQYLGKNNRSNG